MSADRRTHPYGRSAQDVRRERLRSGRTRRVRIAQIIVFALLAILLVAIAALALSFLRTPPEEPGVITQKTVGAPPPEVVCPDPGATPAAPEDVAVTVLNGTDRSGLAARISGELGERGYAPGEIGNTTRAQGAAVIQYGPEGYLAAVSVQAQIPAATLQLASQPGSKVAVLLGPDFDELAGAEEATQTLQEPAPMPEGCG